MEEEKTVRIRKKRKKTEATVRIGRRIRSLRTNHGLPQAKVSELSGISAKYLSEVERGEANISIELISRIAAALDVPLSTILEAEHERPSAELIAEIVRLAPRLKDKDAQIAYRVIKMLTD